MIRTPSRFSDSATPPSCLMVLDDAAHAAEMSRRECWVKAQAAYTRALCRQRSSSTRHDKARLYAERGRCCLRRSQPAAALRDFNTAVHLAPDVARHWQLRGQARRRLGEEDLALEDGVVSANLDAERLGCIFSKLLPPVVRPASHSTGETKWRRSPQLHSTGRRMRTVLPRDDRGLPVVKKSPEQLFEQARPELRAAAMSYASREAERHHEAQRARQQAEAREQQRAEEEAKAEADAQNAQKLRLLHRQYIELELARARSQLTQLASQTSKLVQRIADVEKSLEVDQHTRTVLEEEVRIIENGSAALRRSKRAEMKREEFASTVQAVEAKMQKRQELQQLQHQVVQRQDEQRATVQRLRDELSRI